MQLNDPTLFRQQALIDGNWRDANSGETIAVTNPANGQQLGSVPKMGADETREAINAANRALPAWRALTAKERFTALQSGEVDILSRNTTWTSSRDGGMGFLFAGVNYYDGIGFLTHKKAGLKSAKELDGATIGTEGGTTTEMNMADYFHANNMKYTPVVFDNTDQTVKGFESGRCDVLTSDKSQLFAVKIKLAKPDDVEVLPEIISKEPLGPMVRQGDEQWELLVKWTVFSMINAEELGVTSKNADEMLKSGSPDVKRLLGADAPDGTTLGAVKDWGYQIVKQVGNYAEVFDRNVGKDSPLKIVRTENNLWNKGGFLYAPPVR